MTYTTDTVSYRHSGTEVACSLGPADAVTRVEEWRSLRELAGLGVEAIEGGLRLWVRPDAYAAASDLARREAECCGFLDFELAREGDRARLDVTSPVREAAAVIRGLIGGEARAGIGEGCCDACC